MLQNDPEYRAQVEAVEAERRAGADALQAAEQPIIVELRKAGSEVNSVWDLVNTSDPYPDAFPILFRHLERGDYPDRVMESRGRALAVKPSIAWRERLKALYLNARNPGEEDGTAVALAACATEAQLEDLVAFLSVGERGESRIYFLRPIMRLGGNQAVNSWSPFGMTRHLERRLRPSSEGVASDETSAVLLSRRCPGMAHRWSLHVDPGWSGGD